MKTRFDSSKIGEFKVLWHVKKFHRLGAVGADPVGASTMFHSMNGWFTIIMWA